MIVKVVHEISSPWQSKSYLYPYRVEMLRKIAHSLEQKRHLSAAASNEQQHSVWPLAKRIEANLFYKASSIKEYCDSKSLLKRMRTYIQVLCKRNNK